MIWIADSGRPCDLAVIDLARVGLLHHAAAAQAADRHEDQHHVLRRDRHRVLEHVVEQLAPLAQPQIVAQELHELAVARIADRLVVEVLDLAGSVSHSVPSPPEVLNAS